MMNVDVEWIQIGSGMATNFPEEAEGRLIEIHTAHEVLAVVDQVDTDAWEPTILLVHEAGGTTLGPLLGEVIGVISTKGTLGAHIALLTKEYGCPCIVGTDLSVEPSTIRHVRLRPDGTVWGAAAER